MLLVSPFIPFLSSFLIFGTLMAISSTNWIFMWMGLEMNLMSFIAILSNSKSLLETEACIKYFLTQAVGSSLLLMTALYFQLYSISSIIFLKFLIFIFMSSLLIKLGAAPYHFWIPQVMAASSWMMCMILLTWQKIAPLFILSKSSFSSLQLVIVISIIFSSLVGGLGGLNQTQMRALLAYSSINHISWMISASIISFSITFFYFLIYVVMNIFLLMSILFFKLSNTSMNPLFISSSILLVIMFLFLSLGGIPPLMGFAPKWMVFLHLSKVTFMSMTPSFIILILILGSMISLSYYFNIIMSSSILSNFKIFTHKKISTFFISLMLVISSFSLTLLLSFE